MILLNDVKQLFHKLFIVKSTHKLVEFFRYFFVSIASLFTDFILLFVLTTYAGFHYLIAAAISYVAGLVVNYLMRDRGTAQQEVQVTRVLRKELKRLGFLHSVRQGEDLKIPRPSLLRQILRRYEPGEIITLDQLYKDFQGLVTARRPQATLRQAMRRAVECGNFVRSERDDGTTVYERRLANARDYCQEDR